MRTFPTTTRLGQRMRELGLYKYDVCGACKISDRLLTEYLAGRRDISPINRQYLAAFLKCSPEWLQPDHGGRSTQPRAGSSQR